MKRAVFIVAVLFLLAVSVTTVWAGGDKVRGDNGEGDVNQVSFDNQDNQN